MTISSYFKIYILLLLITVSYPIFSKEIKVCKECSIVSIKNAIALASAGDTISIGSGSYSEGQLEINKPISVVGENDVSIDGLKEKHVIDIRSDGVSIKNLTIVNSGVSDIFDFAGIHAEDVKNCRIENNRLIDNTYGVYLANVKDCFVSGNISSGNAKNEVSGGNGIHLWSSSDIKIEDNKLERHRDGIYLEFSNYLKIQNNTSRNNIRYGMHFMFSSDNIFLGNLFEKNSAGVAVMYSKNIVVEKNTFRDNWGESSYGIVLKDISKSSISENLFTGNTTAILADGSNHDHFINNNFINNGWAIKILGNSDYNILKGNNFLKNVFDVGTNSKSSTNEFIGNFWDKYRGYDLDRNGFGDVPHKPIQFFGYWVAVFPFLMILYESPVVLFLEGIERAFPIVTPIHYEDGNPRMSESI